MKITFVANFMNHHQLPFSLKMMELTVNQYLFVAMKPLAEEQRNLGYEDMNSKSFVLRAYESKDMYQKALQRIIKDDMVIFGSCPDELLEMRERTGKPFIIYSERFFKKGTYRRFIPITTKKIYRRMLQFEGSNVSIICSSAYLPYDLKLLKANFQIYKWGYFPETKHYDLEQLLLKKNEDKIVSILWVGRLIKLKHPDMAIKIAKSLKDKGFKFRLNIIGDGNLKSDLQKMVVKYNVENEVKLLGVKSTDEVRNYMEKANIFLFTSDYQEGWGAVMNEAMNSGCAVVASHAVGSVPFLLQDGKNGFIYKNGDFKQLYKRVEYLFNYPEKAEKMGIEAYKTIIEQWNPEEAANRLYRVIDAKVAGRNDDIYSEGPCSLAAVIDPHYRNGENK